MKKTHYLWQRFIPILVAWFALLVPLYSGAQTMPNPIIVPDFDSDCIYEINQGENPDLYTVPDMTCQTVCLNTQVNYSTALVSGNSYLWTVTGNNNISGVQNVGTVTWGALGQFFVTVTETNNTTGESQSYTTCVEVVSPPSSAFDVTIGNSTIQSTTVAANMNNIQTCINNTVCFNDLSVDAVSWYWDFGGLGSSSQQSPCFTFTTPGIHIVTLTAINECGCEEESYLAVNVGTGDSPEITCGSVICDNGTFTYNASIPGNCPSGFYQWNVSGNGVINGNSSGVNLNQISVTWNSGPIGTISLSVSNCQNVCNSSVTLNIPIIPPVIDIEGDALVCTGDYGQFHLPCFPGTEYEWTVNDGVSTTTHLANGNEVSIEFPNPGVYTISASYNSTFLNCAGASNAFTVIVNDPFEINGPDVVCENGSVVIDGPMGSQLEWEVLNVNGTGFGPSSSYNTPNTLAPGFYSIIATDVNQAYCNETASHGIEVIAEPPAIQTINGLDVVCNGSTEIYTATALSNDYYLEWEVLNNNITTISNGNSVTVTWAPGPKSVMVYQVSVDNDCKSQGLTLPITDLPPPSLAISGNINVCANTSMTSPEVYTATAGFSDYQWSIAPATAGSIVSGQGTNSANVIWNNFTGPATITVTPEHCGVAQAASSFQVNVNAPVLTMTTMMPATFCQNAPNNWQANFNIAGGTYTWSIEEIGVIPANVVTGQGNTITNHPFLNSGSYVISFHGEICGITHTVTQNVTVLPAPVANLSATSGIHCIDQNQATLIVSVQGAASPYTYSWNGPNVPGTSVTTHMIGGAASAGLYTVEVTDANGCTSVTNQIQAKVCSGPGQPCTPVNGSTLNLAANISCNTVNFMSNLTSTQTPISYEWSFSGNNQPIFGGPNESFSVQSSGIYNVQLLVHYASPWCPDTAIMDVEVEVIADFEINFSCAGSGLALDLVNTSDATPNAFPSLSHLWTVNPGGFSATTQDFTGITGLTSGQTYTVTLQETGPNTACTISKTFVMPDVVSAAFTTVQNPYCENTPIQFTDMSGGNVAGWSWDFGDGSTILTQNPARAYSAAGNYNVQLTVTDEYGCMDVTTLPVVVVPNNVTGNITGLPQNAVCPGTVVNLGVSTSASPYAVEWMDFSTGNNLNVSQTSTVSVTITDNNQCSLEIGPEVVEFVELPTPVILGEDEYCDGEDIELNCNHGVDYNYSWFEDINGSGFVNTGITTTDLTRSGLPVGTHVFRVDLEKSGCTVSETFTVTIHPLPAPPNIGASANCLGPIQLFVSNSGAYDYASWSNGEIGFNTTVVNGGMYYAEGTDINGCSNSANYEVFDLPDFCSYMCGCFTDCIDPVVGVYNFPGVLGSYPNWGWQMFDAGTGTWTNVLTSPTPGTPSPVADLTFTTIGSRTIRLWVETINGCIEFSCETDLHLEKCPTDCNMYVDFSTTAVDCHFDFAAGQSEYHFYIDMTLFNNLGNTCDDYSYTFIPPYGTVQSASPSILNVQNPPNNVFVEWLTGGTTFFNATICFQVQLTNLCDGSICYFEYCEDVMYCPSAPPNTGSGITSIKEASPEINIYPNPTSGSFMIDVSVEGDYQIEIFDISGKKLNAYTMAFERFQAREIDAEYLTPGVYFVKCSGIESSMTTRLIVK